MTEVTVDCELLHGVQKPSPRLLERQPVLLTAEPCLQPPLPPAPISSSLNCIAGLVLTVLPGCLSVSQSALRYLSSSWSDVADSPESRQSPELA